MFCCWCCIVMNVLHFYLRSITKQQIQHPFENEGMNNTLLYSCSINPFNDCFIRMLIGNDLMYWLNVNEIILNLELCISVALTFIIISTLLLSLLLLTMTYSVHINGFSINRMFGLSDYRDMMEPHYLICSSPFIFHFCTNFMHFNVDIVGYNS